jgi:hypothetical protein
MKIGRVLIFVSCALAAGITLRYAIRKFSTYGSIAGHTAPLKEPIPAYTRSLRPNYPYSIIPGGAYTAAELRNADQQDEVVKEHYSGFDMKNAKVVQLTDERYQYASYRLKTKVYWTKKKLRIPKGEVLLTDGTSWARARCGNRLSEQPHKEVSDEEPPIKALAVPPMELGGPPMELAEAPPLGEYAAIPPGDVAKFPPVLPPSDVIPPELPPLVPVTPPISIPPLFPPIGTPSKSTPVTPPNTPPILPPIPPVIPPGPPPVTPVPEPNAVYLFLVTFILSLYGLTRMVSPKEDSKGPVSSAPPQHK